MEIPDIYVEMILTLLVLSILGIYQLGLSSSLIGQAVP